MCGIQGLTAPGKRDSPKLSTGCRIAILQESGMQDFRKKGAEMRDPDSVRWSFKRIGGGGGGT